MLQDGNTYLSNTLEPREITLTVTIIADSVNNLIDHKNDFYKILNPKNDELWLTYQDDVNTRKVKCIVNKLPFFTVINQTTESCLITLTANNPFWLDYNETREQIALWLSKFEFPLEILESGIEMASRSESLFATVNNEGQVETGMRILFKALATVENPSLYNINTAEYIKINKTMTAGEHIEINTNYAEKTITSTINGVTTDAFVYLDFVNSTFLQLSVGDNIFRYDADDYIDNLEVDIYYTNKYLGV
jgi:hypothetical protein